MTSFGQSDVSDVSRGPHALVQFDCRFALMSSTVRTGPPDNHLGHTMEHNASSFKTFSFFFFPFSPLIFTYFFHSPLPTSGNHEFVLFLGVQFF